MVSLVQQSGQCLGFHRRELEKYTDPPDPGPPLDPSTPPGLKKSGGSSRSVLNGRPGSPTTSRSSHSWSRGATTRDSHRMSEEGYEDYRGDIQMLRTLSGKV